ncbi:hypothetical protein KL914_002837 [Ogataea haglerorum]|uniref:Protein phosphatase 1 regulatory subunit 7 n=1 Tax=Ogataea haglerorum TaxID=1937702 RepID=A0ABQ7RHY8_9ASCO|nr:hypothetical protein KL951_003059 [Ogataea haglerorum]KAG7706953.1 hypothetical protein KL914_002837 [Ogataea haglerorum]KAG7739018.1 hypothetical protein KL923_002818 [Ogataea haglerorum]KAG7765970.1 hypothetical protein KL946_002150 [Ogataea haglerorum]
MSDEKTDKNIQSDAEMAEIMSSDDQEAPEERGMPRDQVEELQEKLGMQTIDDPNPEVLPSDRELTEGLPDDVQYIDLIQYKIRDLDALGLERFHSLESLVLRDNLLESANGLKKLPNKEKLEELDLYDNRIKHISKHINEFTNLTTLDLSFNNIKNIKHLEALTKLENLYFVQNRIKEIRNLETLKNLKNLELGGNRIEVISETLLHLPSVEQLWLGKNMISKFENLQNLKRLRVLSIQSNKITKIENLDHLESLEELYLSHNKLTKLEGLDNLHKLMVLDVTANQISKLENLSHLTELTDFWCSYNKIDSFDNVREQLGHLPNLDTVYFEGNPIQLNAPALYRTKLKLNLGKSLQKIDAMYINQA